MPLRCEARVREGSWGAEVTGTCKKRKNASTKGLSGEAGAGSEKLAKDGEGGQAMGAEHWCNLPD